MAFRRILEGWKEHASFIYRSRQLEGVLNYLDHLLESYLQMVDNCEVETVDGSQQASFILGVTTALPNGGRSSTVERETEWQEHLGAFRATVVSTKM